MNQRLPHKQGEAASDLFFDCRNNFIYILGLQIEWVQVGLLIAHICIGCFSNE